MEYKKFPIYDLPSLLVSELVLPPAPESASEVLPLICCLVFGLENLVRDNWN